MATTVTSHQRFQLSYYNIYSSAECLIQEYKLFVLMNIISEYKLPDFIYSAFSVFAITLHVQYRALKYTGDVSLLLKHYVRIHESNVIFHTGPGGHSDYYAGFTMTLHA